jgi:hypothetical protein
MVPFDQALSWSGSVAHWRSWPGRYATYRSSEVGLASDTRLTPPALVSRHSISSHATRSRLTPLALVPRPPFEHLEPVAFENAGPPGSRPWPRCHSRSSRPSEELYVPSTKVLTPPLSRSSRAAAEAPVVQIACKPFHNSFAQLRVAAFKRDFQGCVGEASTPCARCVGEASTPSRVHGV